MMAFLPMPALAREMRRRNANGRQPIDCCENMHPTLASSLKTFFIQNGVDLADSKTEPSGDGSRAGRSVKLQEIVGLAQPRERILHGQEFQRFLVTCIATELELEIVEINTQDVLSYRLGGTEKQVRAHFERAVRTKPRKALVIINEFENLSPRPTKSSASWHGTLRQCFLTLFDATIDPMSEF
ncbi:hypothetical protein PHYPSEUDO_014818 [Phytophthora pseudosyringae]|uniref:ATPase AAA-type core domain-containing protein n=1 Tax=Phytophthora pseudosyringae TaxID=221518 RepID=A0A8T1W392_9STRA|nr:hypothetical protein PHYPSEUDO_014818 [Phytophthora pseudosyringae]